MSEEICTAVWNADPQCIGWTSYGHPFHGCEKGFGHQGIHQCKCGSQCTKHDVLPPPRVR
jgi:hypothetical protein